MNIFVRYHLPGEIDFFLLNETRKISFVKHITFILTLFNDQISYIISDKMFHRIGFYFFLHKISTSIEEKLKLKTMIKTQD